MPADRSHYPDGYEEAVKTGRPPNMVRLFPNPKALIVSGKYIDRAMRKKGGAIAQKTHTTKANLATALQMISWGVAVNDYGNAMMDDNGDFIKVKGEGMTEEMWTAMVYYAEDKGYSGGNYKELNLPFENRLLGQPAHIREWMVQRVATLVGDMLMNVLNGGDTAPLVLADILETGAYNPGPKSGRIEDPAEWTPEKIRIKAASIDSNKGAQGDFDD